MTNFFALRRTKKQLDGATSENKLPAKIRRMKEREVTAETTNMEEVLTMEEELTNAQDAVVNNIRDVKARYQHLTRVLNTKQMDCHSAASWLMIMMFVPMWLYAAIFVSLTIDTYRKDVN